MDTLTIINKLANFINSEQKEYDGNLIILPNSSESLNSKCFYDDFLNNTKININIKKYSQINISFENLFKSKFYNFKKIDYEYKNKKNTSGRITLKKYCKFCQKHTPHKETK